MTLKSIRWISVPVARPLSQGLRDVHDAGSPYAFEA